MAFVLDSSVVLAWILPDEQYVQVDEIASRLETEAAIVPAIWPLEIHNALLVAERRDRIEPEQVESALRAVTALAIHVDHDVSLESAGRAFVLARALKLSAYDASYLELAGREGVPVATVDRRLREACQASGIPVLPS